MTATIKDVAHRAGVSIATVSFVINNTPNRVISEQVRKRVMAVAKELNYHPRASAVGLAGRRTRNLTFVFYKDLCTVSNQFRSWVVEGAIKEATDRKYNLLFSFVGSYRGEQSLPKTVLERNTDGVILIHLVSPKMVQDLGARSIPCLAIDNTPAVKGLETIGFDARLGGKLAAQHLVELGHKSLGFVGGGRNRPSIAAREQGFIAGLREAGLSFDEKKQVIDTGELTFGHAYEAAKAWLRKNKTVTGVLCANDEQAAGVLRAAFEAGVRVPDELSVVGFDDIAMSGFTVVPLTTVNVDKTMLGRVAVARLIQRIDAEAMPTEHELVPVRLEARGSTAAPKRR